MSNSQTQSRDRFEDNVYNVEIGDEMPDFENIECEPAEHAGDRAAVIVFGAHDEDVRKVTMCTECQMVTQEVAFDNVQAITLEGVGTNVDRMLNYPGEQGDEEFFKLPKDDVLDEKAAELGYDDYEVTHAGHNEDELMFKIIPAGGRR